MCRGAGSRSLSPWSPWSRSCHRALTRRLWRRRSLGCRRSLGEEHVVVIYRARSQQRGQRRRPLRIRVHARDGGEHGRGRLHRHAHGQNATSVNISRAHLRSHPAAARVRHHPASWHSGRYAAVRDRRHGDVEEGTEDDIDSVRSPEQPRDPLTLFGAPRDSEKSQTRASSARASPPVPDAAVDGRSSEPGQVRGFIALMVRGPVTRGLTRPSPPAPTDGCIVFARRIGACSAG